MATAEYYNMMPVLLRCFNMTLLVYMSYVVICANDLSWCFCDRLSHPRGHRPPECALETLRVLAFRAIEFCDHFPYCPLCSLWTRLRTASMLSDFTGGLASRTRRGGPYPVRRASAPRRHRHSLGP